jgi:hypothetical protein
MLPSGEYFLGRPLFFFPADADDASMLNPDDPSYAPALLLRESNGFDELKGNRSALEEWGIIVGPPPPELWLIIIEELLELLLAAVVLVMVYEVGPTIMFGGCGGGGASRESI